MGFANSVRMMLAQEQSITIPLFGFNVGLEIGQIAVVIIVLSIFICFPIFKIAEKTLILLVSAPILVVSLKMAIERIPF
jgi:hypothetical protein